MKVTVYITAYNYGEFIVQAIDSVFSQTFKNWELIVINDGSIDSSIVEQVVEELVYFDCMIVYYFPLYQH